MEGEGRTEGNNLISFARCCSLYFSHTGLLNIPWAYQVHIPVLGPLQWLFPLFEILFPPHIFHISFFYHLLSKNYPGYPVLNSTSHTFISQCGVPHTLLSLFDPLSFITSNWLYIYFLICLLVEYKLGMLKKSLSQLFTGLLFDP